MRKAFFVAGIQFGILIIWTNLWFDDGERCVLSFALKILTWNTKQISLNWVFWKQNLATLQFKKIFSSTLKFAF